MRGTLFLLGRQGTDPDDLEAVVDGMPNLDHHHTAAAIGAIAQLAAIDVDGARDTLVDLSTDRDLKEKRREQAKAFLEMIPPKEE